MLLTEQKRIELTPKFEALLDTFNNNQPKPTYAVIVKLEIGCETVGAMSYGGSYTPSYSKTGVIILQVDLVVALREIFNEFRALYPRNRTLFFRYNRKLQKLQIFAASTMALASQVL
jgi:hypothetical protein